MRILRRGAQTAIMAGCFLLAVMTQGKDGIEPMDPLADHQIAEVLLRNEFYGTDPRGWFSRVRILIRDAWGDVRMLAVDEHNGTGENRLRYATGAMGTNAAARGRGPVATNVVATALAASEYRDLLSNSVSTAYLCSYPKGPAKEVLDETYYFMWTRDIERALTLWSKGTPDSKSLMGIMTRMNRLLKGRLYEDGLPVGKGQAHARGPSDGDSTK